MMVVMDCLSSLPNPSSFTPPIVAATPNTVAFAVELLDTIDVLLEVVLFTLTVVMLKVEAGTEDDVIIEDIEFEDDDVDAEPDVTLLFPLVLTLVD